MYAIRSYYGTVAAPLQPLGVDPLGPGFLAGHRHVWRNALVHVAGERGEAVLADVTELVDQRVASYNFV